jgi:DNA repair exonuclease SbcCD ATPase subunit
MVDILLILVGALLAVTVVVAIEYYRIMRRAQKEYEKAKEVVEDIVLSFNRQLKHETEKLEIVAYKVEAVSSKIDGVLKKSEEAGKSVQAMEPKIVSVLGDRDKTLARLDEVVKKVSDVMASQAELTTRITNIEEQAKQLSAVPEPGVEPVIPIRRDKALAPLTETELSALEYLASEGPRTAPEIKWRIRLSREHTARLMKKLYESGYLERDTNRIPFKYSVKKEMERLLKKTEGEAPATQ